MSRRYDSIEEQIMSELLEEKAVATAKKKSKTKSQCIMGKYCSEHGWVHGYEAEALRSRLEELVEDGEDIDVYTMQTILDDVDARDSLSYREKRPRIQRPKRMSLVMQAHHAYQHRVINAVKQRLDELVRDLAPPMKQPKRKVKARRRR